MYRAIRYVAPLSNVTERFGRVPLHKVTSFAATIGLILATVAGLPHSVSAANRSELWVVVHGICLPAYQGIDTAFPCAEVHPTVLIEALPCSRRLRAPRMSSSSQPLAGIESPALLRENAPNYWEAAWDAHRFVEEKARRRLPRDKIGMAINSAASSRSQDQLHIHVGCIAPAVADFLSSCWRAVFRRASFPWEAKRWLWSARRLVTAGPVSIF